MPNRSTRAGVGHGRTEHGRTAARNGRGGSHRPQMQREPEPPFPRQKQAEPGLEAKMKPLPRFRAPSYKPGGKLTGKVALVTGGDSGIGRAVAVIYAREGADVAIVYLPQEEADAQATRRAVQSAGRKCLLIAGDLVNPWFCRSCVEQTVEEFGKLDILVSNAAHQARHEDITQITEEDWDRTFRTNIYAFFYLVKAAMPHLKPGASIIATSSETGLFGNKMLLDYSSTKGAINAFVKSLAQNLIEKGIRVNAVAPGPVWTPLNVADPGEPGEKVRQFGSKTQYERPAQPEEIAPAYVFFASDADSSYVTGQVLAELGGSTNE